MLKKTLIAAGLLAASGAATADHVYARVIAVEPNVVITYSGGGRHDGYRIFYEFDGRSGWTVSPVYPGPYLWVPRPVYVEPAYWGPPRPAWGYRDDWRWHHRGGWRDDGDRHDWGRHDGGRRDRHD
jgi:hypothetical protein